MGNRPKIQGERPHLQVVDEAQGSPTQDFTNQAVEPAQDEPGWRTRVELMPVVLGTRTPLHLELGEEPAIVIKPKADEDPERELALDIIAGGGLTPEIVAWMLAQASETIINGIRDQEERNG